MSKNPREPEAVMASVVDQMTTTLSEARRARGLSQAEVAMAAGITRNHYQSLESGQAIGGGMMNPRLSTLVNLACALDLDLHDLLPPTPSSSS